MKKGFTLIELLVVIAIIGILSSVVLVSLNSARNKGKDTRVISTVQQLRTLFESSYSTNYASLLTTSNTTTTHGAGIILGSSYATYSTSATGSLLSDANANGGVVYVVTDSTAGAYAIYGRLPSNNANFFCIDSTGGTNQAKTASLTAITCN